MRGKLDLIVAEIAVNKFEFARRFPHSKRRDHFALLEGRTSGKRPEEALFGEYAKRWWSAMEPGMSAGKVRDYRAILDHHLLPFFKDVSFSEIKRVLVKKFVAQLQARPNRYGEKLSGKTIRNVLIPLRVILWDAVDEYGWTNFPDPFARVELPRVSRPRIQPFSRGEWATLMEHMPAWYRPYFDFAVLTGLRPSEQVALKWKAIDGEFIHIELSRVRSREKRELKTKASVRRIEIRPSMRKVLEEQRELTKGFGSEYVFVNTEGRPVRQEKVGEVWQRAIARSGLPYRRPYETRHSFASWALASGKSSGWVANTLGHVDTSMVCRTYGRYIPNLTRRDGSAFEREYDEAMGRRQSK